uniref:Core Histone H2A/H2B/H3 domain-containing protein n=1 Tax=Strigamia maritima TaxID=126957 RepID=T1J8B6_STRMM
MNAGKQAKYQPHPLTMLPPPDSSDSDDDDESELSPRQIPDYSRPRSQIKRPREDNDDTNEPKRRKKSVIPMPVESGHKRTNQDHDSRSRGNAAPGEAERAPPGQRGRPRPADTDDDPPPRARKRYRPGVKAAKEIQKFQNSTDLLIRKLPFSRLVREVCSDLSVFTFRWEARALEALQEASEAYLVDILEHANLCVNHAKRVTLYPRDIRLVKRVRGMDDF